MAEKRVVYIQKIKTGSKFRTLGEVKAGKKKSRYNLPQFPAFTISIHPDYAKFLPLSPQWQTLQHWYIPGAETPKEYQRSFNRAVNNVASTKFADFMEFMFEDTLFDPATQKEIFGTSTFEIFENIARQYGI